VIDARMGEVYAGAFRREGEDLVALNAETVGPADQLVLPRVHAWSVIGSGWETYREVLRARLIAAPVWADGARYPQAHAIARLAAREFAAGHAVAPEAALPVYLRDKVALTLAEQRR